MKTSTLFRSHEATINPEGSGSGLRDALSLDEKQEVIGVLSQQLASQCGGIPLDLFVGGSLGTKDSAHDVFFARTVARGHDGKRQSFACKRFRRYENAEREINGLQQAHERGFKTLEVAGEGIYSVGDIGHVVLTKHMPRFTTMNQIGWQDYFVGHPTYDSQIVPALEGIAGFVADMHHAGIVHDDLQLKNIGKVPPADFVLFDLEGATFFDPVTTETPASFEHLGKATNDMSTMVNSLVGRGFLWNSTDEVFTSEITDHLMMPYLLSANMHDTGTIESFDKIIDFAQILRGQVHGKLALTTQG